MDFDYKSMPVVTVYNSYKRKLIDTTPDFQRDLIWKKSFKEELIISMLKRYPIGNIVFNINEGITEIVDGKQRLTSIFEFLDKDKPLYLSKNSSIKEFREFIHYYMEKNENILSDEEKNQCQKLKSVKKVFYKDLPSILKDDFNSYNLNVTYLKNTESEQEVAEYFTRLQNQESLRAGEIVNSVLYYNKELFNLIYLIY